MCDKGRPERVEDADDDVWEEGFDDGPAERIELDREWETRHQQFYNSGYREGLDEGKELTLQCGFNAGFTEGARAGYEFGAVRGVLQTLVALYEGPTDTKGKEPISAVQQQLQSALQQLNLQDDVDASSVVAAAAAPAARPAGAVAGHSVNRPSAAVSDVQTSGSSGIPTAAISRQQLELSLPQQLVAHVKAELAALGFEVGLPPSIPTACAGTTHDGAVLPE